MAIKVGDDYTEIIIKYKTSKESTWAIRQRLSKVIDILEFKVYKTKLESYFRRGDDV